MATKRVTKSVSVNDVVDITPEQMDISVVFYRVRFMFDSGRVVDFIMSRDTSTEREQVLKMTGEGKIVGSTTIGVVSTVNFKGEVVA